MSTVLFRKNTTAIISKSGSGSNSTRVHIPVEWAEAMGITKDNNKLSIEFTSKNEMIIKKAND